MVTEPVLDPEPEVEQNPEPDPEPEPEPELSESPTEEPVTPEHAERRVVEVVAAGGNKLARIHQAERYLSSRLHPDGPEAALHPSIIPRKAREAARDRPVKPTRVSAT